MSSNTSPTVLSLFCGAGGLDLGFRREGFKVLLACDKFPAAVASYNLNTRPKVGVVTDLSMLTTPKLSELITKTTPGRRLSGVIGGPPCQGFSRGNVCKDPSDPRNRLPFKYADILGELNAESPLDFFVFENVMGLVNSTHRSRFEQILRQFEGAGFRVFHHELDASSFSVPQVRRRLFIVGLNAALFPQVEFVFPKGKKRRVTVRDAISGLPRPTYFSRELGPEDVPYHQNHWTMRPKSPKFTSASSNDGRSFRRLGWDAPSPTVAYGNREIHVHPDGGRRLSIHEAMLLQGFPATYRLVGTFSEQVTQVSNAVPPPVASALARKIRAVIRPR
jgi:DNA (cytosine-5)-methyltransferase 1